MMKIIKKVGSLVAIFILTIYNTCFADVVMTKKDIKSHGMYRRDLRDLVEPETEPVNYILIGILVLVVVVCTVIIIRRIIKKKKEKENDNK